MNSRPIRPANPARTWQSCLARCFAVAAILSAAQVATGASITLWDTGSSLPQSFESLDRAGWKPVPTDLLRLETDPPKASSDPGYYGREYTFTGDAVVENAHITAVFASVSGRVSFYLQPAAFPRGSASLTGAGLGARIADVMPLRHGTQPSRISRLEIVRNATDTVALEASFSAAGDPEARALIVLDKTGVVEIKPVENVQGFRLVTSLQYGIVPGFVGDDLIFGPGQLESAGNYWLPAEHCFVGLLPGEGTELMLTWPGNGQQLALRAGEKGAGKAPIESIDFENAGQSLYLAGLSAPGVWHREPLTPGFLEKDATISWRPPFAARWKTQLLENGVKTTFAFRQSKGEIWRGVAGSYDYPVWFHEQEAWYHLSKKVPPKGESLIYSLEGEGTPPEISMPVDILQATLGRQLGDAIIDLLGRKLRTHHRRGGDGVRRACTCGCTEAIQTVFEAGEETEKRAYVQGALEDMVFFVHRHVERIDEYRRFAADMIQFLKDKRNSAPQLKEFLDALEPIAREIPDQYEVQKENLKSFPFADELVAKTLALTARKDPGNVKAYLDLLGEWRAMGGAQDGLLAQCHVTTRKLFQEAGYRGAFQAQAASLAGEIRTRCTACLRNPDGYEIWADY